MHERGVLNYLVGMIGNYLTDRVCHITLGSTTVSRRLIRGTPQGGWLSPLLWLYVNEVIMQARLPAGCSLHSFADDTTIQVRAATLDELGDKVGQSLTSLASAAAICGLTVNSSRTEILQLCRVHQQPTLQVVHDGATISSGQCVRSLGVHLDPHLNFLRHVNLAIAKAE